MFDRLRQRTQPRISKWSCGLVALGAVVIAAMPDLAVASHRHSPTSQSATSQRCATSRSTPRSQPVSVSQAGVSLPHQLKGKGLHLSAFWGRYLSSIDKLYEKPAYRAMYHQKPRLAVSYYPAGHFSFLLPHKTTRIGEIYRIVAADALPLLRQIHAGASVRLHHFDQADGGFAAIRAISSAYVEIVFRLHAEFELKRGEVYLTPGHFSGRLILRRRDATPLFFSMAIPTQGPNIDMNAKTAIDIGHLSALSLQGGSTALVRKIAWRLALPKKQLAHALTKRFYRFQHIKWHSLAKAMKHAEREQKPLHIIVLFGTLDDQSC